jgi:perosamine synthetase|tara:strand:+ start:1324 stop:2490 length:1167 start_codon:yes stop_codon:yes gene_type:complete
MKKNLISEDILKSIKFVIGKKKKNYFLHEPSLNKKDRILVNNCIDSNFVSTVGKYSELFSNELKKITKAKYVLCLVSGTSALHLAINILGIKKNEEILLPSLTFVATGNVILYNNSVPHFIEIDDNLLIDLKKLENYLIRNTFLKNGKCINKNSLRVIKAIIPMHIFGHICNMSKLRRIAKKFKLLIIEDAAEALGSYYNGKHAGTFGQVGVLSFNGNKIITTGMGGAILTNSKKLYEKANYIASQAKQKSKWEYIYNGIGYNYKLPSINAALGLSQLKRINKLINAKRNLFKKYLNSLRDIKEIRVLEEPKSCKSNYWLNTIILDKKFSVHQKNIIKLCHKNKIFVRPVWKPLHQLDHFKHFPKMDLKLTNRMAKSVINLPSSSFIK